MAISEQQESWAVSRMNGLGGTDLAAILGMSNWRTPIEVWQSKVDPESVPAIDNEILWFGRALEPVIRERYSIRFERQVVPPANIGLMFPNSKPWQDSTIVVGSEPWMLGAADGWQLGVKRGLEVKNVGMNRGEWGDEETDEIPAAYLVQCHWYNLIHDAQGWDVAPLFSGHRLSRYVVPRDAQLEKEMYEVAREFWFDYIVPKVEPPIDQTESYGRYLARKFSLSTGSVIKNPSHELTAAAAALKDAQDEVKAAEETAQLRNNQLAALLANADAAITPSGKVAWVRPSARKTVDWNTIASAVQVPREIIAQHTKETPVTPYVRGYWK